MLQPSQLKHHGIHNFCYGILDTYFKLESLKPQNVTFEDGILTLSGLPGRAGHKTWVYREAAKDLPKLIRLQFEGPIYSQDELFLDKRSKFTELQYSLPEVFNPAAYANAKKRAKRLTYPSKWLVSNGFEFVNTVALDEVNQIHNEWKQYKLSLDRTFKMMFPSRRYYNCVAIAQQKPELYKTFAVRHKDIGLCAMRVLYVDGSTAFDLANFSVTHKLPSNFSEYFNSATMKMLFEEGILTINCGASLHKELTAYKKHWPHSYVVSYAYGQIT